MPDSLCAPCKVRGIEVVAMRLVPEGSINVPKCNSCWRNKVPLALSEAEKSIRAATRQDPTEEAKPMARKSNVDWSAAQRDRDGGMSVAEIAKRLGVHVSHVYTHTKSGGRRGPQVKTPRGGGAFPQGNHRTGRADLRDARSVARQTRQAR